MIEALLLILPLLWAVWRVGPLDYDGRPLRRRGLADDDDDRVK